MLAQASRQTETEEATLGATAGPCLQLGWAYTTGESGKWRPENLKKSMQKVAQILPGMQIEQLLFHRPTQAQTAHKGLQMKQID